MIKQCADGHKAVENWYLILSLASEAYFFSIYSVGSINMVGKMC